MAGIMANSPSQTMGSGDTAVDKSVSGYLLNEQITLTTSPTAATYSWAQTLPAGATTTRSGLSSSTAAGPTFTPTVAGTYLVTCNAAGTTYQIRIGAIAVSPSETLQVLRFLPVADASVPTPSQGRNVYFSEDQDGMAQKDTSGNVSTFDVTPV